MHINKYTKQLAFIFMLLLLTACGQQASSPQISYKDRFSEAVISVDNDSHLELVNNDSTVLAWDSTEQCLYELQLSEDGVDFCALAVSCSLAPTLWGLDSNDTAWFYGYDDTKSDSFFQCYNLNTGEATVFYLAQYDIIGVYEFTYDSLYVYLTAQTLEGSCILVFDHNYGLVTKLHVSAVSACTQGYLPVEEEWAEELEGREDDTLYTQLFPESAADSLQLCKYTDGSVGVLLNRSDPLSYEKYIIPCTVEWNTGAIMPQSYFFPTPQDIAYTNPCVAINQPLSAALADEYDLLMVTAYGIEGFSFERSETAMLHTWNKDNMPVSPNEPFAVFPEGPLIREMPVNHGRNYHLYTTN